MQDARPDAYLSAEQRNVLDALGRWWDGSLGAPGDPFALYGLAGTGKTTALQVYADGVSERLGDMRFVQFHSLARLGGRYDEQAIGFLPADVETLVVFDDADQATPDELLDALERLRTVRPLSRVIVCGRQRIEQPWPTTAFGESYVGELGALWTIAREHLTSEEFNRLLTVAHSSPDVVRPLVQMLDREPLDAVLARLDPQRYELASDRQLDVRVRAVSDDLVLALAARPDLMYELHPRKFEELMAELYLRRGFEVELTPATRDGGVDLYVVSPGPGRRLLTVVDVKRYAAHRKVGVGIVRQLYGVVEEKRANAGIIATTSFFSKEAQDFREKVPFRVDLQDYLALQTMLHVAARTGSR